MLRVAFTFTEKLAIAVMLEMIYKAEDITKSSHMRNVRDELQMYGESWDDTSDDCRIAAWKLETSSIDEYVHALEELRQIGFEPSKTAKEFYDDWYKEMDGECSQI